MRFLGSRDCYSRPEDVYRVAKARGMDLVAITDHDIIDGALELLERTPDATDVIVGEEVSCWLPDGDIEVHLGVYGMTEALHRELQPLRRNVFDVVARLREARRVLRAESPAALLSTADAARRLPAAARRGAGARGAERHDAAGAQPADRADWPRGWQPAARRPAGGGGGQRCAHAAPRRPTWTEAPGRDRDEFLAACATGSDVPAGATAARSTVAGDAYGVIARYIAQPGRARPARSSRLASRRLPGVRGGSLPFQFLPLAIALAREVARAAEPCVRSRPGI